MYVCSIISHRIISPDRLPSCDRSCSPRAVVVHSARPENSASVLWLTPSLRCARRNLLQAPSRDCCTVLRCCAVNETAQVETEIVTGPPYRAVCAWPLHLQTLFSLSFPAFPEAVPAYFCTPSIALRPHLGHTRATMGAPTPADGNSSHSRATSADHRPSLNTHQPDPNSHVATKSAPKSVLKKRSADEHTALLASQRRQQP